MTPHLLQSISWETFQKALGTKTLRIPTPTTDSLGVIERPHGKVGKYIKRLYLPYGPTLQNDKDSVDAVRAIEQAAKTYDCDVVRIEPMGTLIDTKVLVSFGYQKRSRSAQPSVTSIVSLDGTEDEIIARMNATNRNLWRKNQALGKEGIQFRVATASIQAQPFLAMMHETSARSGAIFHSDAYFKTLIDTLGSREEAGVMIASVGGADVAATLFVVDRAGATLYYLHAGSTKEARQFNAGNILVSNLIIHAKSLGLMHVDLFGVCPDDAPSTHPLYGISKFKRAYGGVDVIYCGTWEKSMTTKHRVTMRISSLIKRGS